MRGWFPIGGTIKSGGTADEPNSICPEVNRLLDGCFFYIREVVIVLQSTEEWRWHKGKQTSYKRRKQNNTMKERTTCHEKIM
ncbi:hypothetical protein A4V01_04640 [Erysipelotrichaceae bacterium I46]|nr:hypothetical protein A4V01_04640 [Erysipelotrichaceae bacterium I46]ASU19296.1 hypothetical protein ADH65_12690 [[Clostridium] innocuum]